MTDNRKLILSYSNIAFAADTIGKSQQEGFEIVASKGKSRIIDEIISLKPFAVAIDGVYCESRSMKATFLLQKIRHVVQTTPVFLFNSDDANHVKLMADDLVYAVITGPADLGKLTCAIKKYINTPKRGGRSERVRSQVQLPCLLKKLGTSGLMQGKICDLSPKGMKIVLERPCDDWSTGDELRFSIPKKSDTTSHLDGYGHLRWSKKQEVGNGFFNVHLGVEFSQLPLPTLYEFLDLLNNTRAAA
jgi:hypothetical protein